MREPGHLPGQPGDLLFDDLAGEPLEEQGFGPRHQGPAESGIAQQPGAGLGQRRRGVGDEQVDTVLGAEPFGPAVKTIRPSSKAA